MPFILLRWILASLTRRFGTRCTAGSCSARFRIALFSPITFPHTVHVLGLAVAGLLLAEIVRREHPGLAPWFSLAFYLNPALHEVTLTEVRRVTFAVPYLALACYALYTRRRVWMAVGLGVALLCKENIAVVVFAVGMYLLLFERDWRWGSVLTGVGAAWAIVVTFWVVAAFRAAAGEQSVYPQLNYFGLSGDSYRKVLANLAADPRCARRLTRLACERCGGS